LKCNHRQYQQRPTKKENIDEISEPTNPPTEEQVQKVDEFLSALIEKADEIFGQELPSSIVEGINEALLMRADDLGGESFLWEDLEVILEDVCHEYDKDTWFDIQEAFFVAWEENEIQKMGGDLEESLRDETTESGHDEIYDQ